MEGEFELARQGCGPLTSPWNRPRRACAVSRRPSRDPWLGWAMARRCCAALCWRAREAVASKREINQFGLFNPVFCQWGARSQGGCSSDFGWLHACTSLGPCIDQSLIGARGGPDAKDRNIVTVLCTLAWWILGLDPAIWVPSYIRSIHNAPCPHCAGC
ncbi:hypothetical protein MAPG_03078 [Magnaporthiopsis poae ATCC 64411]|uniref:Uncharacterized protein n=1 Tax=Magnaporthiopsis poae (strain ATCC 64411 / 73-15) TaxID=644358 RepID=A0A0C4DT25_MAGP6|nr:hypothetical protein MAPG_03078 [Magnaporthiopsis poae ATCC 64411]